MNKEKVKMNKEKVNSLLTKNTNGNIIVLLNNRISFKAIIIKRNCGCCSKLLSVIDLIYFYSFINYIMSQNEFTN